MPLSNPLKITIKCPHCGSVDQVPKHNVESDATSMVAHCNACKKDYKVGMIPYESPDYQAIIEDKDRKLLITAGLSGLALLIFPFIYNEWQKQQKKKNAKEIAVRETVPVGK